MKSLAKKLVNRPLSSYESSQRMEMTKLKSLLSKMPSLNLNTFSSCTHSTKPFIFTLFSSFSSLSNIPNPLFANFLIHSLHFSNTRALTIANNSRFTKLKSLEKPQAFLNYFQNLGFSPQQIQSCVHLFPHILLSDVDKTLKPKIDFLQQLGLSASHLGKFVSKNPLVLHLSLEKNLIPSVEIFKKILVNDKENKDLFKVLSRASWLISWNINSRVLPNVRFFQSCGIVGSRLALLFKRHPALFIRKEASIRNIVSRVSNLGFNMNSRMFPYALSAVGCTSADTFKRKVQTFERFGFSEDEYMEMIRKCPLLCTTSMKKLDIGLDFYLNTVKLRKEVIINNPVILMLSMEKRVVPRYRVLKSIMSKQLLKEKHDFKALVMLSEVDFLEKFVKKFPDHAEELLMAFRGHSLDHPSQENLPTI